ncbi:MAG: glycosyltransferase family 1 protein [Dehalococcoidia bacterium]|nr:glycosyltransferase family 1 protein [Dehalococcoidia bacterium]
MRVALISMHTCPLASPGEGNAGGMNVYVRHAATELAALGSIADVFTRQHPGDHEEVEQLCDGARIIHVPAGPASTSKEALYEYVPTFLWGVLQFARRNGLAYDVVHGHYWLSGRAGLDLRDAWNTPLVATFHTLGEAKLQARAGEREPDLRVLWERRIVAGADALMVSTEHERDALQRLYGVSSSKIAIIAPGVDVNLFKPLGISLAQQALGLDGKRVLLFVGRLDPVKGLDIALEAMSLLEDQNDLEMVVVGGEQDGKTESGRLQALAQRLGVGDRVRFTGPVAHEDLPYYYSAAEALVMPSYYESFGLAALEAMACGTPVVAARVGGLPWVVRDGVTGYLVPWHCPEPFSRRLEVLLTNKALRDSMGRAARERALTHDWREVAREMLALYTETMNGERRISKSA